MVLGLGITFDAYAVMYCDSPPPGVGTIASINNGFLVYRAWADAKQAAEDFLAIFATLGNPPPKYVWIQPLSKLWIDGQD